MPAVLPLDIYEVFVVWDTIIVKHARSLKTPKEDRKYARRFAFGYLRSI